MEENYLKHHGTKGMKWGIRRYQNKDGTLTNLGKKRKREETPHEDYVRAHSKTSVKTMSNQELNDTNKRLQAERQFEQLSKKKSKGKKAVDAFIAGGTTIAAITAAYAGYKKVIDPVMSQIGNYRAAKSTFKDIDFDFS